MTPLRLRMTEDMRLAGLVAGTQAVYINAVSPGMTTFSYRNLAGPCILHNGHDPPQFCTSKGCWTTKDVPICNDPKPGVTCWHWHHVTQLGEPVLVASPCMTVTVLDSVEMLYATKFNALSNTGFINGNEPLCAVEAWKGGDLEQGKIWVYVRELHANPYIRVLRSQLEPYIIEELGSEYLVSKKSQTELRTISKEIAVLRKKLAALEARSPDRRKQPLADCLLHPDTKPTGHSIMPPAKVDQWLGAGTGETLESSLTTSMRSRFPRARARQPGDARHAYPTRARPSPLSLAAAASLRQLGRDRPRSRPKTHGRRGSRGRPPQAASETTRSTIANDRKARSA
jgi:hypothetical protein